MSDQQQKEILRLASLVGTDAKDPENKLLDYIDAVIEEIVEDKIWHITIGQE